MRAGETEYTKDNTSSSAAFQGISSTCSTESTISLMSSKVTPGMMRSASVNARCKALRAILASWEETRGNSYYPCQMLEAENEKCSLKQWRGESLSPASSYQCHLPQYASPSFYVV